MALRVEEMEPRRWDDLAEVYAACDPHGWDATRHTCYPTEWSERTSTDFGDFDLGWVGMARAVDAQAPHPIQPAGIHWMDAGAKKNIHDPSSFAQWARHQIGLELGERPRWRRSLARIIQSSGKEENSPIAPRQDRGVNESDETPAADREQDAAQYLAWADKLPMTRNVQVGPTTANTWGVLHVAAGWVDTLMLGSRRWKLSRDEAELHIDERALNSMLIDLEWLQSIYRLSPQQAKALSLYLQGFRQEAIGTHLGMATSTAKEHLDRARKKVRDLWGVSPTSTPLHMRRQSL